jgi:hypothetical protein
MYTASIAPVAAHSPLSELERLHLNRRQRRELRKQRAYRDASRDERWLLMKLVSLDAFNPHTGEIEMSEERLALTLPPVPSWGKPKRGRPNESGHIARDTLRKLLEALLKRDLLTRRKRADWRLGSRPRSGAWVYRICHNAWQHAWGTLKALRRPDFLQKKSRVAYAKQEDSYQSAQAVRSAQEQRELGIEWRAFLANESRRGRPRFAVRLWGWITSLAVAR